MASITGAMEAPRRTSVSGKKKFTTPPVKVACLQCRASRIRCDGKKLCTNCSVKGRSCSYAPSKRGGPRISKAKARQQFHQSDIIDSMLDANLQDFIFNQTPSFVDPGAGLNQLDFFQDSDFIFDSLFQSNGSDHAKTTCPEPGLPANSRQEIPTVRLYASDEHILDAYYVFMHSYFPILPPPVSSPAVDRPLAAQHGRASPAGAFEPSSPISLAISTILALIPHPDESDPSKPESILLRRKFAQSFAESTMESIEIESELIDSNLSPSRALTGTPSSSHRRPFHPNVPIDLESILALCILCIYEYAQRGNLNKMRNRAGQALVLAMDMSLHSQGDQEDPCAEAKSRAWWMCYTCVCQGSIVGSTPPSFSIHDPRFTTRYPTIAADPDAWAVFIQAQQTIITATQFIMDQNRALETKSNLVYVFERMQELNSITQPLIARADTWAIDSPSNMPVDASEAVVALGLKGMARIKLNSGMVKVHRYCAFTDTPVFTEKHCDLKSAGPDVTRRGSEHSETAPTSGCACGNLFDNSSTTASSRSSSSPLASPSSSLSSVTTNSDYSGYNLPFSSHQSAKICLKAALNIAQSFDNLPYPNTTGVQGLAPQDYSSNVLWTPRTMPSFACCAMQSSYAMLMLCHKTRATNGNGLVGSDQLASSLLCQLRQGLQKVIGALENYSMTFEALSGMRDQIQGAMDAAFSDVL